VHFETNKKLSNTRYRPDFLLPDHNLIIECDGLYWHSELKTKDKKYHKKKKEEYQRLGYNSLFFRENEILEKFEIVKSIINNKLSVNNNRFFARKCYIKEISSNFFEQHHLMGKGSGKCFGLFYRDDLVVGTQVKWVNKNKGVLEISRFCPKFNTTVVGGFSKLLNYVERNLSPNVIQTFIDSRYGIGGYLEDLGFYEENRSLSFKWVDLNSFVVYNRMQFPGNSGYDYGLYKIWDCGQSKYELVCA
jgi:hypothetical protein